MPPEQVELPPHEMEPTEEALEEANELLEDDLPADDAPEAEEAPAEGRAQP